MMNSWNSFEKVVSNFFDQMRFLGGHWYNISKKKVLYSETRKTMEKENDI